MKRDDEKNESGEVGNPNHADGKFETINKNLTRNIPITFFLNYPAFPDSCILIYFSLRIYIYQMFINCTYINIDIAFCVSHRVSS